MKCINLLVHSFRSVHLPAHSLARLGVVRVGWSINALHILLQIGISKSRYIVEYFRIYLDTSAIFNV
jgi:hypothetical protein